MPRITLTACRCVLVAFLFTTAAGRAAAGPEQDQYEEKLVARGVERAVRVAKSDRVVWVKELEEAFPEKVGDPVKEEEYAAWFVLLAGEAVEWRRDSAPNARITELFDRIVQRLELGPVPSIKRDEFMRYARKVLVHGNPRADGGSDPNEDPDRVFRVLDRDSNGNLEPEEMTTKLREEKPKADGDGNGRIDKDEYRAYYRSRVAASAEAAVKAADQKGSAPGSAGRPALATALPAWFTGADEDEDGQVSLAEWRKSGRAIDVFTQMDLDGDGQLTKEEYARYARTKEKEAADKLPPKKSGKN
jgi:Ca2+-binding EF-hand superfamily protein